MKRTSTALVLAVLATGLATGLASAGGKEKLQLHRTHVGTILVNGRGFTVYVFTRDGHNRDVCQTLHGCPQIWPAVKSTGKATAGAGLNPALIGSITISGGAKQVTYAGHPLYTYSGDSSPAETEYVDFSAFGGHWPALNASGREVK